jgi:SAM-dependent methyltransferase
MSDLLLGVLREVDHTIARLVEGLAGRGPAARALLDVGCWDGEHTERYARLLKCQAHGIEVFEAPARRAGERGIEVARVDLETQRFPWPDASMDVVVCNQVFEHLKNVWTPMSEIARVLRPDGWLVLSVPNLGSLHNRALLALGRQPTSIRTLGPHVRGYTFGEIRRFVGLGGAFAVERALGVGFYPFPASVAAPFARLWPGAAHTTVVLARRVAGRPAAPWLDWFAGAQSEGLQTFYEPAGAASAERAAPGDAASDPRPGRAADAARHSS